MQKKSIFIITLILIMAFLIGTIVINAKQQTVELSSKKGDVSTLIKVKTILPSEVQDQLYNFYIPEKQIEEILQSEDFL